MMMIELIDACRNSQSGSVTLVSKDTKAPFPRKGFPRAELLCQNSNGETVWLYNAKKLRASLQREMVAQMQAHLNNSVHWATTVGGLNTPETGK